LNHAFPAFIFSEGKKRSDDKLITPKTAERVAIYKLCQERRDPTGFLKYWIQYTKGTLSVGFGELGKDQFMSQSVSLSTPMVHLAFAGGCDYITFRNVTVLCGLTSALSQQSNFPAFFKVTSK
jgi:hypothetical protein